MRTLIVLPPALRRIAAPVGWIILAWMPLLVAFAAYRPGIMSADSIGMWREAQLGVVSDSSSALYAAVALGAERLVGTPSAVTLAQTLLLAGSVVAVGYALRRLQVPTVPIAAVCGLVLVTPMVGAFSVSLWKDIPHAAFYLLFAAASIHLIAAWLDDRGDIRRPLIALLVCGYVLGLLRQNALITVAVSLLLLILGLRGLRSKLAATLLVVLVMVGATKTVVYPLLGVKAPPSHALVAGLMHDVAAIATYGPELIDGDDREWILSIGPIETWREHYTCSTLDPLYFHSGLPFRTDDFDVEGAVETWIGLAREAPLRVLRNRLCATAHAWRPDATADWVYTVSEGIDPNDLGLRTRPISDSLRDTYLDLVRWTDHPHRWWYLWRAPFWIYVCLASLGFVAIRARRLTPLLLAAPLVGLQASWIPMSPAQDARYMFPALMLAVLLLPVVFSTSTWRVAPQRPLEGSGAEDDSEERLPDEALADPARPEAPDSAEASVDRLSSAADAQPA